MIYVSILTMIVPVLLVVAFQTLAERQLMASMQRRVGPQVSGFGGILQPFWDGMKLGVKEPLLLELSASGEIYLSKKLKLLMFPKIFEFKIDTPFHLSVTT